MSSFRELPPSARRVIFGHDEVEQLAGRARIEQRDDVRVIEAGDDLDLAQEALATDRRRDLRLQDFDRDAPPVLDVVGEIHGGHAAGADLGVDAVAIGEDLECRGNHGRAIVARSLALSPR